MTPPTQKLKLDLSPEAFGELRVSSDILADAAALQARMREDGYLYLPGCLNHTEVLDTRCRLASEPIDERWIGGHPIGHGEAAWRDLIC